MTRTELIRRTLYALDDAPGAPVYWSVPETADALNDAQEVFAERSPYVKRSVLIPRREGGTVYQTSGVAADMLAPYRLWLPDLHRRLQRVTLNDLDARHQHWWTTTGEPWWWCGLSWDTWLIWPPPTTGEGWLQIDYYAWPAALDEAAAQPELAESLQPLLVEYAVMLGKLKQWDAKGAVESLQALQQAQGHLRAQPNVNQFQSRIAQRSPSRGEGNGDGVRWG